MTDQVMYVQAEGEPGQRGKPGRPGRSAYELACDAGFRGTVPQWLESLRQKGDPGPPGPPGHDATLVPSLAMFERDEQRRTERVTLIERDTGELLATITPIRDQITGLMEAAEIIPA